MKSQKRARKVVKEAPVSLAKFRSTMQSHGMHRVRTDGDEHWSGDSKGYTYEVTILGRGLCRVFKRTRWGYNSTWDDEWNKDHERVSYKKAIGAIDLHGIFFAD